MTYICETKGNHVVCGHRSKFSGHEVNWHKKSESVISDSIQCLPDTLDQLVLCSLNHQLPFNIWIIKPTSGCGMPGLAQSLSWIREQRGRLSRRPELMWNISARSFQLELLEKLLKLPMLQLFSRPIQLESLGGRKGWSQSANICKCSSDDFQVQSGLRLLFWAVQSALHQNRVRRMLLVKTNSVENVVPKHVSTLVSPGELQNPPMPGFHP